MFTLVKTKKEVATSNGWTILCDEADQICYVTAAEIAKHMNYIHPLKSLMELFREHYNEFIKFHDFKKGESKNQLLFTKYGCLKLAKLSLNAKLNICEEVLTAFQEANYEMVVLNPTLPINNLYSEFRAAYHMALSFGLSHNIALLSANKAVQKIHGHDCLKLFEMPLPSSVQEKLLTPTDIGWFIGINAEEVNKILEYLQYQESYRDKKNRLCWKLTDKGKEFGIYIDTGKVSNSGSIIQQIKWYEKVIHPVELTAEDFHRGRITV